MLALLNSRSILKITIICLVATVAFSIGFLTLTTLKAEAAGDPNDPPSCTWSIPPFTNNGHLGRCAQKGYYFNNEGSGNYSTIFSNGSNLDNDNGLPVYNVNQFISYIFNKLDSGNAQDKTGASFIINTMLYQTAPGYGKNIPLSVRSEWESLVRWLDSEGAVTWSGREHFNTQTMNSQYDVLRNDDMFYRLQTAQERNAIIFRDPDTGAPWYKLKKNCGNPIGTNIPPPKTEDNRWEYTLNISNPGNKQPGDFIDITSVISNPTNFDGYNNPLDHNHRIWPSTGSQHVSWVSATGGVASDLPPSYPKSSLWSNFGPITSKNNLPHQGRWRINSAGVSDGTEICFTTHASPKAGPVGGVDEWGPLSARSCFRVTIPVVEWDYTVNGNFTNSSGASNFGKSYTANAGDTVYVKSTVTHSGAIAGDNYTLQIRPMNPAEDGKVVSYLSLSGSGATGTWYQWLNQGALSPSSSQAFRIGRYQIAPDTPDGTRICLFARASPANGSNISGTISGSETLDQNICLVIFNQRYDLSVSVSGPTLAQPGDRVAVKYIVCNSDPLPPGSVRGVAPNITISIGGTLGTSLSTVQTISADPFDCWEQISSYTIPASATVGEQLCTNLTTDKDRGFSNDTGVEGTNSKQHCVTVAVSPYFHVYNGDVWAGAIFDSEPRQPVANCGDNPLAIIKSVRSDLSGLMRGSFVEYAAFATGEISGFGSSGSETTPGPANEVTLTFANTPGLGNYTTQTKCIPNYFELLYDSASAGSNNAGNVNSFTANTQTSVDPTSGTFRLAGQANIEDKRTIVIEGNLVITGDVTFNSANYGNSSSLNIPSLVFVVSGDIYIDQSVSQIDALLISQGEVWTCSSGNPSVPTTEVAENVCNNPLVINGAIVTNRLNLMRTHEGGGLKGGVHDGDSKPAEIINFLPEFYLSEPIFESDILSKDFYRTVLIKDLPPVY